MSMPDTDDWGFRKLHIYLGEPSEYTLDIAAQIKRLLQDYNTTQEAATQLLSEDKEVKDNFDGKFFEGILIAAKSGLLKDNLMELVLNRLKIVLLAD